MEYTCTCTYFYSPSLFSPFPPPPPIFPQLDEDSSKYQSMHQELTEALALMEELKRQESRARADRNEAEVLAEKRLEELGLSQEKCHTLHCINGQLEEEVQLREREVETYIEMTQMK